MKNATGTALDTMRWEEGGFSVSAAPRPTTTTNQMTNRA